VGDAFLDLADTIITVRSLIRSGMDHLPVRQPSSQATVITHLSARAPTHSHIAFKSVSGLPARATPARWHHGCHPQMSSTTCTTR
jgi:hypothetical protein